MTSHTDDNRRGTLEIRLTQGARTTLSCRTRLAFHALKEWVLTSPLGEYVLDIEERPPLSTAREDWTEIWAHPRPGTGTTPYLIGHARLRSTASRPTAPRKAALA